jgi:hypothetical protein
VLQKRSGMEQETWALSVLQKRSGMEQKPALSMLQKRSKMEQETWALSGGLGPFSSYFQGFRLACRVLSGARQVESVSLIKIAFSDIGPRRWPALSRARLGPGRCHFVPL